MGGGPPRLSGGSAIRPRSSQYSSLMVFHASFRAPDSSPSPLSKTAGKKLAVTLVVMTGRVRVRSLAEMLFRWVNVSVGVVGLESRPDVDDSLSDPYSETSGADVRRDDAAELVFWAAAEDKEPVVDDVPLADAEIDAPSSFSSASRATRLFVDAKGLGW